MRITLTVSMDVDTEDAHLTDNRLSVPEQVKRDVMHLLSDIGYARAITVAAGVPAAQLRVTES